jgi:hypothetical protein
LEIPVILVDTDIPGWYYSLSPPPSSSIVISQIPLLYGFYLTGNIGVNALALVSISTGLDSPAFRVVATAITIFLVISWLILAPLTIWNLKSLLKIPKNNKAPQNWHEA